VPTWRQLSTSSGTLTRQAANSVTSALVGYPEVVKGRTVGEVALAIVHESTHARMYRMGVEPRSETLDRIEHMCIDQEVASALLTPEHLGLASTATAKFDRPWWDKAEGARRMVERLRSFGMPHFVVTIAEWLTR